MNSSPSPAVGARVLIENHPNQPLLAPPLVATVLPPSESHPSSYRSTLNLHHYLHLPSLMRTSASVVHIQRRLPSPNPSSTKVAGRWLVRWWVSFLDVPFRPRRLARAFDLYGHRRRKESCFPQTIYFFVSRFTSPSDRDRVLFEGLSILDDAVLVVEPRTPSFRLFLEVLPLATIWI